MKAFPTWVINGAVVEGELDLEQVAAQLEAPPAPSPAEGEPAAAVAAVGGGEAAAVAALEAVEKMVILVPASWLARVRGRAARMAVMLHV